VHLPGVLVSATRLSEAQFWRESLLGQSLRAMPTELRPELAIRFDNTGPRTVGLPELYNRAIESAPGGSAILFVHDDVYLHDAFLMARVSEALEHGDLMGLAGSSGAPEDAVSWALDFTDELNCTGWHSGPLVRFSGAVSHTTARGASPHPPPLAERFCYGRLQAHCDVVDGLFLAALAQTLQDRDVRFDERFTFHLYDTDFCRTARARGLRLITYPLLVSHASAGNYDSAEWRAAARLYREKWASAPHRPEAVHVPLHP
jgi:hypothetical protein